MSQYVRITLEGGNSYYEKLEHVGVQVLNELDGAEVGHPITLHLELVNMTDEEFMNLPDFEGH